jgi:hypothetical protein
MLSQINAHLPAVLIRGFAVNHVLAVVVVVVVAGDREEAGQLCGHPLSPRQLVVLLPLQYAFPPLFHIRICDRRMVLENEWSVAR